MAVNLEKLIFQSSRSTGRRDTRRASDCDSKKNEYSTSWRPEMHRKSNSADMSGVLSRSFARPWPEEVPAVARHNYSVPGDPRLPSAEGFNLSPLLATLHY